MVLRKWEDLPENMRVEEVRPYYDILCKKKTALVCKRLFDIVVSLIMLIILSPAYLILAIAIKLDSKGPVFYRQIRVTQYGREFKIHKFRSMCDGADKKGTLVTIGNDNRVTRVGRVIRNYRLDELPQLIDVFVGDMSFVGTRPEVVKYAQCYSPEMMATLLLSAGITCEASISYKDEDELLNSSDDVDKVYVEQILPGKMQYNLDSMKSFSFWNEIKTMVRTVFAVIGVDIKNV